MPPASTAPSAAKQTKPANAVTHKELGELENRMGKRLDDSVASVGDSVSEKFDEFQKRVMEGFSGLNARDHPNRVLPNEHDVTDIEPITGVAVIDLDGIDFSHTGNTESSDLFSSKEDWLNFMAEKVVIRISQSRVKSDSQMVSLSHNGRMWVIPRGLAVRIPRYILEILARTRADDWESTTTPDLTLAREGQTVNLFGYEMTEIRQHDYQVIQDQNPKGAKWLLEVESQRN